MHESVIREPKVLYLVKLLPRVNILENKWWVRLVPAAAVIPAPRVGTIIIGPKASVACLINFL